MKNPLVIVNNILIEGATAKGSITLPVGITSIGLDAFNDCRSLTEIVIPLGGTSIVMNISGCINLQK